MEASFFPGKHDIVVLYFREVRRHFGFVCRGSSLTARRECVLEVNEVAGGFLGGLWEEGVLHINVDILFFFFSVQTLCLKKEGVLWKHQQLSEYIANPIGYGES